MGWKQSHQLHSQVYAICIGAIEQMENNFEIEVPITLLQANYNKKKADSLI